jgi:hypothetical protein
VIHSRRSKTGNRGAGRSYDGAFIRLKIGFAADKHSANQQWAVDDIDHPCFRENRVAMRPVQKAKFKPTYYWLLMTLFRRFLPPLAHVFVVAIDTRAISATLADTSASRALCT